MERKEVTQRGRLLIIDDEPSLHNRLVKWLTKTKYRYAFVDSVDEAKRLLEHKDYDAVVYAHEFLFKMALGRKVLSF